MEIVFTGKTVYMHVHSDIIFGAMNDYDRELTSVVSNDDKK